VATLWLQLEEPVVVTHPAVVADRARALQAENPVPFGRARRSPVIILGLGRGARQAPVVFRQILPLQVPLGLFVAVNLLPSQFLHPPVLMPPLSAFYPAFGRRRTGREQLDP
jgi:hypothetical protein